MDIKGLFKRLTQSSISIKIATLAVIMVWGMVLIALLAISFLLTEQPTQTQAPAPGDTVPTIRLDPGAGPPGTTVHVQGEGWVPGSMVLIYLMAPGETELPSYAIAGFNAGALGQFTTGFVVPSGPGWKDQGLAMVVAREAEGGAAAQVFFNVMRTPEQLTATSVETAEPTATPAQQIPPTPTTTPQPEPATAAAVTDLNIRSGPGIAYAVLGVLRAGQSAEITGISPTAAGGRFSSLELRTGAVGCRPTISPPRTRIMCLWFRRRLRQPRPHPHQRRPPPQLPRRWSSTTGAASTSTTGT
jgi:hypothetical protein